MLSTAEIEQELQRLSYKPGWHISIYEGAWEGQHIVIRTSVPDAYNPGSEVVLDVHSMLPPQDSVASLHRWIAWRLGRLEVHEMREFFRRDGKAIFDPHAEFADRDLA